MTMTLDRFEDLLDLYGPDFASWPRDDAASARALLNSSVDASIAHESALLLNASLNAYEIAPPSAAFEAKLLDLAPSSIAVVEKSNDDFLSWFSLKGLSIGATALACAAFGFTIGISSLNALHTNANAEAFVTASYDSYSDESWYGDEG